MGFPLDVTIGYALPGALRVVLGGWIDVFRGRIVT